MTDSRALTLTQVAAALGINRRTAAEWVRIGRLRGFKTPGGHWRVPEGALEDADVTAAQCAVLIGVHKITVRRWCEAGRIECRRAGENGHWLIPVSEVKRLRAGRLERPAGAAGRHQGETKRGRK